jgi:hypothetical protein
MHKAIKRFIVAGFIAVGLPLGLMASAASAATVTSASAESASQARTGPPSGPVLIIGHVTGDCLEGDHGGVNPVYTASCTGGPYQHWILNSDGTIANSVTGCLTPTVTPGGVIATILPCEGGDASQQWVINSDLTIFNPDTQQVLTRTGNQGVCLEDPTGSENQKWDVTAFS